MKAKKRGRSGAGTISTAAWAYLNDALDDDTGDGWERWALEADQPIFLKGPSASGLWTQYGDVVLARWRETNPGKRPAMWWRHNAPRQPLGIYPGYFWDGTLPIPRARVGGVGTPLHDVSAFVPRTYLGVPIDWHFAGDFLEVSAIAIDLNTPPLFESQASWLQRLDLLGAPERRRLPRDAFEPESVLDILSGRRVLAGDAPR